MVFLEAGRVEFSLEIQSKRGGFFFPSNDGLFPLSVRRAIDLISKVRSTYSLHLSILTVIDNSVIDLIGSFFSLGFTVVTVLPTRVAIFQASAPCVSKWLSIPLSRRAVFSTSRSAAFVRSKPPPLPFSFFSLSSRVIPRILSPPRSVFWNTLPVFRSRTSSDSLLPLP